MSETKSIPLESFHAEKGARFVPFAGWNMPVQYSSIIQEHLALRNGVGMFDVSHMGEVLLSGNDSVAYLNHLLTNDFSKLSEGRSKYSMMCAPDGGVVDDLIVYRLGPDDYLICVNASNREKDFEWMRDHSTGFDVSLRDASDEFALLAVQGPKSVEFMQALVQDDLSAIKRFQHIRTRVGETEVLLSRTGYTGEDGFEIYVESGAGEKVANAIDARAADLELNHFYCGLGARDSLRLEAGLPLYGHEISETIDPLTAGFGWTVKFGKPGDFIGRESLEGIKQAGPSQRVRFFQLGDRRIAREGEAVWLGDRQVGAVLSGTYSPVIERAIGSAVIEADAAESEGLKVRLRGREVGLALVAPPIHKQVS